VRTGLAEAVDSHVPASAAGELARGEGATTATVVAKAKSRIRSRSADDLEEVEELLTKARRDLRALMIADESGGMAHKRASVEDSTAVRFTTRQISPPPGLPRTLPTIRSGCLLSSLEDQVQIVPPVPAPSPRDTAFCGFFE